MPNLGRPRKGNVTAAIGRAEAKALITHDCHFGRLQQNIGEPYPYKYRFTT